MSSDGFIMRGAGMPRPGKVEYYLDIAKAVSMRGTCLRRRFGAVLVRNDQIVSTGYAGSPRGTPNCCDIGVCERQRLNIPAGERYELCRSVHAEANAIIHASRDQMMGATLYLYGEDSHDASVAVARPCQMCRRMIINAGIRNVVVRTPGGSREEMAEDYVKEVVAEGGY